MDEKRLNEIRQREKKATPVPWGCHAYDVIYPIVTVSGEKSMQHWTPYHGFSNTYADSNFIAYARQDIPDLLAYVVQLEDALTVEQARARMLEDDLAAEREKSARLEAELQKFAEDTYAAARPMLDRMEVALQEYADENNWEDYHWHGSDTGGPWLIAQEALEGGSGA